MDSIGVTDRSGNSGLKTLLESYNLVDRYILEENGQTNIDGSHKSFLDRLFVRVRDTYAS